MAMTLSSDNWIIAQTVSLSEVTNFAIPARIFAMFGVITAILTTPLWPLNAAALQNGDTAWVRAITKRMVIITSLSVGGLAVLGIILGKQAIGWWLGSAVIPSSTLLCGLGLMVFVQAVVAPLFMVQNGGGVLMAQTVGYILFLIVVPVKWFIATHIGTMWIPFAGAIFYCVLVWPAAFIGYRQTLLRASKDHLRQIVETQ
jgi:O-antigen/teichoic acid export membrane protein